MICHLRGTGRRLSRDYGDCAVSAVTRSDLGISAPLVDILYAEHVPATCLKALLKLNNSTARRRHPTLQHHQLRRATACSWSWRIPWTMPVQEMQQTLALDPAVEAQSRVMMTGVWSGIILFYCGPHRQSQARGAAVKYEEYPGAKAPEILRLSRQSSRPQLAMAWSLRRSRSCIF